ncbi:MAG: VOC family protein [Ignavibacteriae bacterium]|nr:VOC family protein [Ignavibacteriota bacterium]MCB9215744.1 VOC family protein [Ignavibacteria bacterium]
MHFQPGETNIICTNAEASLHFYRDILGFTFVEEEGGAYRLAAGERTYLLLPLATEERPEHPYCSTPEFSLDLYVENVSEAYTYLKESGVTFARHWEEGKPSCIIRDPDGLVVEVIQR